MRHDGVYVHAYCRDRTEEEIESMFPSQIQEFEEESPDLKGYYEKSGQDPLDAIDSILRDMELSDGGEIEYELPDGRYTSSSEEVEKAGSAEFSTTVYKNGRYYNFSGTVLKEGGKWIAGGETDEIEF